MAKLKSEYIDPEALAVLLDKASSERELLSYFATRSHPLYWALCRLGGHCRFAFREFPLGSSYVADFVFLNSYSGVWEVKFVELEPPNAKIFTKFGQPAKRLAGAVKQVDDWCEYFETHRESVRSDLVRWAKTKDLLGYSDGKEPINFSGNRLSDPSTFILLSSHVFMGRRASMSPDEQSRKARYVSRHNVEVASYDRVLDLARERYRDATYWQNEA